MMLFIGGLLLCTLLFQRVNCNQSEIENAYQNVLDNFKQMERYTDSTRTALNKLGTLLGKTPDDSASIKKEKLTEVVAVPHGMKETYKILEKHNVYKRMKSWKRPAVSERNTLLSSELELSYQQLPKYAPKYEMSETSVKLFNDTKTGYVVCSFTFTLDLDYAPLITATSIDHNGTSIDLNVNKCGKEVCFLQEQTLNQQQLILIQHNSMISKYSQLLGIGILISKANRVFYLYEIGSIPANRLVTHIVPDIQFYNSGQSSLTYDPANENGVKLFPYKLQTTLGDLGNVDSIPRASFRNVLETVYDVPIKCIAQDKNKTLLCNTSLDLANNQTNDGTLQTSYRMAPKGSRIFWTIFVVASNEVYPITQLRPSPTQTIQFEMHRNSVTLLLFHSSFQIVFPFWVGRNATVLIHKYVNGKPVTKFSGFQIGVTKFEEDIRVSLTTYDVLLEDAGKYVVTVSTPNQTVSKSFTINVYKRKLKVFKMTATNYTVPETGLKVINVTCRAVGNPRPKIEFYHQIYYTVSYDIDTKLISNDKLTILPEVRDKEEMTSRSILIHQFPGNASVTHSFTVDCRAHTKYQEENTIHHIYKDFWEN